MYQNIKRKYKEFIVATFFDLNYFEGAVTTLAGPQLKRVVDAAKRLSPTSINVFEMDPKTYERQLIEREKHYSKSDNIKLFFASIEDSTITEFIDADLMKTYKSDGKIIEHLITQQFVLPSNKDKCFIGTLSLRGAKKEDCFKWLQNLLRPIGWCKVTDDNIYYDSNGKLHFMRKLNVIRSSAFKHLDVYIYNDGQGPMFTFRVIY